ncbi:hypothetical protein OIU84_009735 [Salix udensis]|uniref:Signal peptidase I n=1 Tax=Salix udensis TaxID=889485 RepID=A0AAD6JJS8_9ROSI|nr:hypothetical protein OIU84_009735 [Salix udensis]
MEPGFKRGDILFLHRSRAPFRTGEIIVYNGCPIPIVHRVIEVPVLARFLCFVIYECLSVFTVYCRTCWALCTGLLKLESVRLTTWLRTENEAYQNIEQNEGRPLAHLDLTRISSGTSNCICWFCIYPHNELEEGSAYQTNSDRSLASAPTFTKREIKEMPTSLQKETPIVLDDRSFYANGQHWLKPQQIIGRAVAFVPYVGWATIIMTEKPIIKYMLMGVFRSAGHNLEGLSDQGFQYMDDTIQASPSETMAKKFRFY